MSNPIKEEFQRFQKLFINYSKIVIGGMILSGVFLFLYSGLRANYVSIAVLTTVLATIALSLIVLLVYVRFQESRVGINERDRFSDEELRKLIAEAIAGIPPTQTKGFSKHVLLSVFQWGHLIGKIFCFGLSTVKFEIGFGKGPKKV